jgi:hypothetical protein
VSVPFDEAEELSMGVDLCSESGEDTGFGYVGWSMVLELARRYGWKPQGTEPPEGMDDPSTWEGEYESSDGQRVTAADAEALADALTLAVNGPKLHETVLRMDERDREQVRKQLGPELAASYVGVKDFQEYRESLREFVEFCRKGAFCIE